MPGKAQICPFCQKRYVNKTGLRNHLFKYTGEWRFPADGIHDVLQIEHVLRRLSPSAYEADEHRKYKCWTCFEIINSRRRFTEHVVYRGHCGFQPEALDKAKKGRLRLRTWCLPFAETTVLIREEPFPFLHLPLGQWSPSLASHPMPLDACARKTVQFFRWQLECLNGTVD